MKIDAKRMYEVLGAIVKYRPEITFNTNRTYKTGKKAPDGIEIRFGTTRPTEEVRALLKSNGFTFSERQKIWYALDTPKTRAFIEDFTKEETDVDDTQYEKLHFWARVKGSKQYEALRNYTEFMVAVGEGRAFYNTKYALDKAHGAIFPLISSGRLYFKKFYNKPVDEDQEPSSGYDPLEIAEKLKDLADGMQKHIDAKLNSATSKQRPTPKRLRVAQSMRENGYRLQNIQYALYALAEAHKRNQVQYFPLLAKIRTKSHIELMNSLQQGDDERGKRSFDYHKEDLEKIGISSLSDWKETISQLETVKERYSPGHVRQDQKAERKIRELEMKIVGMKIPGFFPTPPVLIERMIELAELKTKDHLLEPSAGKGDIIDGIKKHFPGLNPSIVAFEINPTLREILALKEVTVMGTDFLEQYPDASNQFRFDKILMNPPFENGLDIDHVMHAFKFLKPTGRLVAIVSEGPFFRQFKKDKAFREWLEEANAYISEPINDAFKQGFISTGVRVRIIAINGDKSLVVPGGKVTQTDDEPMDLLELEAEAELALLKLKLEVERKRKGKVDGLSGFSPQQVRHLKQKAWELRNKWQVLNFK